MPWGVAAAAVVGLYSASQQSKAAKKASQNQEAAMNNQTGMDQQQLDFAKQQYADWQKRFNPIMDDLEKQAYADQNPDYSAVAADNTAAFDASQGAAQRSLERYGIRPTDGAFGNLQQQGAMQRAPGLVTADTQARNAAKNTTYNRLANLYSMGNGQQSTALKGIAGAYKGLDTMLGKQTDIYGTQANNFNKQAQADYNDAALGSGYGLQNWLGSKSTTYAAPIEVNPGSTGMNMGGQDVGYTGSAPNPFGG